MSCVVNVKEPCLDIEALFQWFAALPMWLGLLCLGASAGIEYVFPPFPGDAITLVGAMLVPIARWPVVAVFGALMAGSMLGAAINWRVGRWLVEAKRRTWLHRWLDRPAVDARVARLKDRFERHGSVYICLNRFLPAFRAMFFIVSGMVNVPFWRVMCFGGLSAALWNAALLGAGYAVGYNLTALAELLKQYSVVVWGVIGVGLVLWGIKAWIGRRKSA